MREGSMAGPESNFWIVPWAPTRSFTCEPPTSRTRMCRAADARERFLLARIAGFSPQALPACKRLGHMAHLTLQCIDNGERRGAHDSATKSGSCSAGSHPERGVDRGAC